MARITQFVLLSLILATTAADVQPPADLARQAAGECARCHVISTVEWSCSGHWKEGTDCIACHGTSRGHVIDERNNVKPDKHPRLDKIAALCLECHERECPSSKEQGSCQTCHHVHALVDPRKPPTVRDERLEQLVSRWERYSRLAQSGEQLVIEMQWDKARAAFQAALREKPGDPLVSARLQLCERRLRPELPGFEADGTALDDGTGLPIRVRIAGLNIPMILVTGGEFDLGSDQVQNARPLHQVRVAPFYLAQHELTRKEWRSLMDSVPAARWLANSPDADQTPVEQVSWEDAQELTRRLNARVAGGAFRLPSETEWEYAARAGGEGDEAFERNGPRIVEQGKANQLGFFDLAGNVREWCSSLMLPYPYNLNDGREAATGAGLRVLRGGTYSETPEWYQPFRRHGERPNRRLRFNGIRLARSIPSPTVIDGTNSSSALP